MGTTETSNTSLPQMSRRAVAVVLGLAVAVVSQQQIDDPVMMSTGTPLPGFTKFLLTDAAKTGAVCLDGSPGGGYIRKGDPKKWIVFHQGGGWCTSDENCAARANCSASPPGCVTGRGCCAMGSSTVWGPTYTDSYEAAALFSDPAFANHTAVYAMYCDGSSWTGDATAPVRVGAATVYYRGKRLLDALVTHLLQQGLGNATTLLYGGCSAGGLTAYLHADYVASKMPSQVRTVALADAMFSGDAPTWDGNTAFPDSMRWGYGAWNATASGNAGCVEHYGAAEGWRCFFGQAVAPFVKTPLFVLNSKYDSWQGLGIIGCGSPLADCPDKARRYWVGYGERLAAAARALPPQHGAFITNCRAHCQTGTKHNAYWSGTTVNGTAMGVAFLRWYSGAVSGRPQLLRCVESCDGSDGACAPGNLCG